MKQKYIIIDVRWCHNCNNCLMGCKDEYCELDMSTGPVHSDWSDSDPQPRHGHRWIDVIRRERGVYARNDIAYLPVPCQHCENAPCMKAGGDAVTRREDGIVLIDRAKAKGNKALADSCPYGAIYYNEQYDVPQKCTMCAHLLDDKEGWLPGMPRCVHNCPTGALTFVECEPSEIEARIASGELAAYKAELGTKPHVLYKNLYRYTKNFVSAGVLVDGDCFEGAKCTIKGEGHEETQETNFFGEFKFDALEDGKYAISIDANGKKYDTEVTISGESLNLGFIKL